MVTDGLLLLLHWR